MLSVSACKVVLFLHLKEERNIGSIYFWHIFDTRLFKSKQTSTKVAPGLAFSKLSKNYYVFGFFENLALFLFWFKTGNKKERRFRIFLFFGADKLMNSHNLVQGRWHKTNKIENSILLVSIVNRVDFSSYPFFKAYWFIREVRVVG